MARKAPSGQRWLGDMLRQLEAQPDPNETADQKAQRLRAAMLDGALEAIALARSRGDEAAILRAVAAGEKALALNGLDTPQTKREPVTIQIVEADLDDAPDQTVPTADADAPRTGAATRH